MTLERDDLQKKVDDMVVDVPIDQNEQPNAQVVITTNAPTESNEMSSALSALQPPDTKGGVCDSCGKFIKGPPSQLKKHKSDHCGKGTNTKPAKNCICPICEVAFDYNGLRHHLQYFSNSEHISKTTTIYEQHGLYTAKNHESLRDTVVEARMESKLAVTHEGLPAILDEAMATALATFKKRTLKSKKK